MLTEDELNDALIFAGATLVILPLVPDRPMGPYGALNPHSIWILVILVMAISAAGYVAVRLAGARFGLPISGLACRLHLEHCDYRRNGHACRKDDGRSRGCSCRRGVINGCDDRTNGTCSHRHEFTATIRALSAPLICAGLAAVVYGVVFTVRALQQKSESEAQRGRAFSLPTALGFSITLALHAGRGPQRSGNGSVRQALLWLPPLPDVPDPHSAAISVASLVASGKMTAADAVFPILAGLSTNTISKIILAGISGGRSFALWVIPGLIVVALAAWAGALGILVSG